MFDDTLAGKKGVGARLCIPLNQVVAKWRLRHNLQLGLAKGLPLGPINHLAPDPKMLDNGEGRNQYFSNTYPRRQTAYCSVPEKKLALIRASSILLQNGFLFRPRKN